MSYIAIAVLYQIPKVMVYYGTGVMLSSVGVYFPRLNAFGELNDAVMHICNVALTFTITTDYNHCIYFWLNHYYDLRRTYDDPDDFEERRWRAEDSVGHFEPNTKRNQIEASANNSNAPRLQWVSRFCKLIIKYHGRSWSTFVNLI